MNIAAIAALALIAALLAVMLKRYNSELGVVVSIVAGAVILIELLKTVAPILQQMETLFSISGISGEYALILFKTLGVCYIAQFAADSCRDAGENALASKVEIAVLLLALPLFESIASTAASLIGK
mgnify:CR=1 FL=1